MKSEGYNNLKYYERMMIKDQ